MCIFQAPVFMHANKVFFEKPCIWLCSRQLKCTLDLKDVVGQNIQWSTCFILRVKLKWTTFMVLLCLFWYFVSQYFVIAWTRCIKKTVKLIFYFLLLCSGHQWREHGHHPVIEMERRVDLPQNRNRHPALTLNPAKTATRYSCLELYWVDNLLKHLIASLLPKMLLKLY